MHKTIFILAIFIASLASCGKKDANKQETTSSADNVNSEAMYQVATLQSLMIGNYDGFVTVGEIRKYGDIGLGTFDRIDGEMIVLDGTVYQARYDGSVKIADDTLGIPFATVTTFNSDITKEIQPIKNIQDLTQQLDAAVETNGKNLIYAVRINVDDATSVKVRSELPQDKPYKPLPETLVTAQREFAYEHISGTIVAVYFPSFFATQNTPGWHFHFISTDCKKGGHMLELSTSKTMVAQLDATPYFTMYMPESASFSQSDLSNDHRDDIEKVEK